MASKISFVTTGMPTSYPFGGLDVIFKLAYKLSEDGFDVSILSLKNIDEYTRERESKIPTINEIKLMAGRLVFRNNYFYKSFLWLIKKIGNIDYDYSILKDVRVRFVDSRTIDGENFDIIIAVGYLAAIYADKYLKMNRNAKGYYIIFHSEDNPAYIKDINRTYSYPLQKIVINKVEEARFKKYRPKFMPCYVDLGSYHIIEAIEDRGPKTILVPLINRKNKDAQNALAAIKLALKEQPDLEIYGFGDMPVDEIPRSIKYRYLPTEHELLQLYNKAAIFVLPSEIEGFSIPTAEAMACGAAVVATDCG
ncbi:MAG: glycosyltransferase family 4 protein, partial [Candidatus Marsarchaeota archaeon]|nr:glycosyltransferase family 4 protein [Candidatus Marsarchaeota archaeon]